MINKNKNNTEQETIRNNSKTSSSATMNHQHQLIEQESAYATALLRSLQFNEVKFLRYFTVDLYNNVRCKVKPVDQLLLRSKRTTLNHQVSIAEVCYGGLPYSADVMHPCTGLNARNVLTIHPDLLSFRNLPYAPKSALVMGNLVNQYTGEQSPLCTRSLLGRLLHEAKEKYNLGFAVGVELEFCLMRNEEEYADQSVFANSTSLNEREEFLSELYEQLQQQYIPVETIHAESGPGQLEVVLQHSKDPIRLADDVLLAQETIRAVAKTHGHKALFLPKYDVTKAGNGMHVHVSLHDAKTGRALMSDGVGAGLTTEGSAFVEGVLRHLPGLVGLTMPTVNSFRRVGKGCWTGSQVGWALEDKECGVRICSDLSTNEWNHVEVKLCDASANVYLALAGLLSAGLDGVARDFVLRPPLSEIDDSSAAVVSFSPLPKDVLGALEALERDRHLMDLMGPAMSQAYLAIRKHDAEQNMSDGRTLRSEVGEAYERS